MGNMQSDKLFLFSKFGVGKIKKNIKLILVFSKDALN